MTDKEELIKAAEVFRDYCLKYRSRECKDEISRCLLTSICDELPCYGDVYRTMVDVIHDIECYDD